MIGMLGVNLEPLWDICHRAPENPIIIIFKEVEIQITNISTVVEFFLFVSYQFLVPL